MWHKCEVIGQSNQVHQLKLRLKITLMKNSQFCEDMSKSKKCNSCNINYIRLTKCLIVQSFDLSYAKLLKVMDKRSKYLLV